jgi:hypothetical protein
VTQDQTFETVKTSSDSTARMGLATRALQTVGDCTHTAVAPQPDGPAGAFKDVEQDAARLGCGSLAAAARLACQVAQQAETDADLFRHAMEVVTLVCLNELQDANGGGHVELADVLAALEERVQYHSRAHQPVA